MNHIESVFAELAQNRGWTAYRSGWPDFLIQRDGKPQFVEVKSIGDTIKPSQARMFRALEAAGIPVLVWWAQMPDRLLPWKKFRRLRSEKRPTRSETVPVYGLSERGVAAVRAVLRDRCRG